MTATKPAITVAISTYNWSSALRCAIRSVLLQSMQDFEILVVGDGCTDDSSAVVSSFDDRRLRWHNLERNHGGQWAVNNYANENAAADWIAYLGHDDIWYPTHLESVLRTARETSAQVVTSVMILYGPPRSGIRGMAGLFATGAFSARDFVPPSALAHATLLYRNGIKWRDHSTLNWPTDVTFLKEVAVHPIASTGELTCFKFNAAWRRDAYKIKSTEEQDQMLRRIETGADFRQREYLDVLQAAVAGKFLPIEMSELAPGVAPGSLARQYRRQKGTEPRQNSTTLRHIEERVRFDMVDQSMPFEWHGLESHTEFGSFRWTGPSPRATIDLPIAFDRDLALRIHIIAVLGPIERLKLLVYERTIAYSIEHLDEGGLMLVAQLDHATMGDPDRDFGITLDIAETVRPMDMSQSEDRRWLGLAVNWCELEPL